MDFNNENLELKQENLSLNDTDSLIAKVCDQFNLKDTIIQISRKTPFQVTSKFIDALILFIFLSLVFSEAGVLKFEYSFPMVVLAVIGISVIIEGFYVNTFVLKKYIGKEANVKRFLGKIHELSPRETRDEINNLFFTSNCISYLLRSIADEKKEYPPYVIESILNDYALSKENLDILFSSSTLKHILPEVIINILPKHRNCLTYDHVLNAYNHFKDNDAILKMLVATQSNSYLLIKNGIDDEKIDAYYADYQLNKKHIDWKLKIIPLRKFRPVANGVFYTFILLFIGSYFFGEKPPISIEPSEIVGLLIGSVLLSSLLAYGLLGGVFRRITKYYYQHLKSNILK